MPKDKQMMSTMLTAKSIRALTLIVGIAELFILTVIYLVLAIRNKVDK